MLEVVDDALSVQEVHDRSQEVPIQRSRKRQVLGPARHIGDGDDLLERNDLDGRHYGDNIDVAGKHGDEEAANHDQGPYRPGNKGLLLLFVFRLWRWIFLWSRGIHR